jgi:hypothetical protein
MFELIMIKKPCEGIYCFTHMLMHLCIYANIPYNVFNLKPFSSPSPTKHFSFIVFLILTQILSQES